MRLALAARLRERWARAGDCLDRWYEELPWRRRVPLGRRGEEIAVRHLRRRGYRIVQRNYRAAGAEIDLIADDGATLVFVEVKARSGSGFGVPAEAVDARKAGRIRRAAASYLQRIGGAERPVRFDVVAITGAGRERRIELVRDAF